MNCSSSPRTDMTRFHLSLNVNDLSESIRFLTALLGCPPVKQRNDYAKFEPIDLPIVLSLEPRAWPQPPLQNTAGEGPLNHVGIRLTDPVELVNVQVRLEAAGYTTRREEGVACCYARQTKFWTLDHDRTMWEVYVLEEDLEHRGGQAEPFVVGLSREAVRTDMPAVPLAAAPRAASGAAPRTWTHRLSEPFPARLPDSGTWDEVHLQGSWNALCHQDAWSDQLQAVRAALRPRGKLILHLLTANEPLTHLSPLPGPASVVQVVPTLSTIIKTLVAEGFERLELLKYASTPCFVQNQIEMRETRLQGFVSEQDSARSRALSHSERPGTHSSTLTAPAADVLSAKASGDGESIRVLYKGPFAQLVDDTYGTFTRGEVRRIPRSVWEDLSTGPWASGFVRLEQPDLTRVRCGMAGVS